MRGLEQEREPRRRGGMQAPQQCSRVERRREFEGRSPGEDDFLQPAAAQGVEGVLHAVRPVLGAGAVRAVRDGGQRCSRMHRGGGNGHLLGLRGNGLRLVTGRKVSGQPCLATFVLDQFEAWEHERAGAEARPPVARWVFGIEARAAVVAKRRAGGGLLGEARAEAPRVFEAVGHPGEGARHLFATPLPEAARGWLAPQPRQQVGPVGDGDFDAPGTLLARSGGTAHRLRQRVARGVPVGRDGLRGGRHGVERSAAAPFPENATRHAIGGRHRDGQCS